MRRLRRPPLFQEFEEKGGQGRGGRQGRKRKREGEACTWVEPLGWECEMDASVPDRSRCGVATNRDSLVKYCLIAHAK